MMFNDLTTLEAVYQQIKQQGLDRINIKHADILPLIKGLNSPIKTQQVGESYEGRALFKLTVGAGPIRIFMWSQMHGNEPTATAALFDLINLISAPEYEAWYQSWKDKISLQIAPMINPDGAEKHQRHNAQSIDINRDARALQSPEGKILNNLAEQFQPHFGFNLHDQNPHYTVTGSVKPTTISLLAPAYNEAKEVNEIRYRAMQIGALFNTRLQQLIPGCVGRYDDTYSHRSFGDNFAAKGIATLLIESGFAPDDPTRQTARWLNFMMLVTAIDVISSGMLETVDIKDYDVIPMNHKEGLVDMMLRDVLIDETYRADISVNFSELLDNPIIDEIGDLSTQTGIEEHDLSDTELMPVRGYEFNQSLTLDKSTYLEILKSGCSYFIGDEQQLSNLTGWPVICIPTSINKTIPQRQVAVHLIFKKNAQPSFALINGQWIDLIEGECIRYSANFSINT